MNQLILAILSALLIGASVSAQVDLNELRRKEKASDERLRAEFDKRPPIVQVSFFINDREIPVGPAMRFSLVVDSKALEPLSIDGGKFLFPAVSRNFTVEFETRDYHFRFDDYAADTIKHGAQMVFAVITDLSLLKTEPSFDGRSDENYEKRSAYSEGRRNVSEERFVKSMKTRRDIESITFFVLAPTVGGDGMAIIARRVNTKPRR